MDAEDPLVTVTFFINDEFCIYNDGIFCIKNDCDLSLFKQIFILCTLFFPSLPHFPRMFLLISPRNLCPKMH